MALGGHFAPRYFASSFTRRSLLRSKIILDPDGTFHHVWGFRRKARQTAFARPGEPCSLIEPTPDTV
jgi:hypothetical protein